MQRRSARLFGWTLSAVALLALSCGAPEPRPAASPAEVLALRDECNRAALRAVDWMIAHADELPSGWTYPFLSRIARVVEDPARRAELESALARDAEKGEYTPITPDSWTEADILEPRRLTRILNELDRQRALGHSIEPAVAALQPLIDAQAQALDAALAPTQAVATTHLLDTLGMRAPFPLDTLIRRAQHVSTLTPRPKLARDSQYLYTLTHLVLARSDYFQRRIDPRPLLFGVPILEAGLVDLLARPSDVFSLDLQAEILMAFQLLGVEGGEPALATRRFLLAAQHQDGRFGKPGKVSPRNVHVTASAIYGLIRYPERLAPRSTP